MAFHAICLLLRNTIGFQQNKVYRIDNFDMGFFLNRDAVIQKILDLLRNTIGFRLMSIMREASLILGIFLAWEWRFAIYVGRNARAGIWVGCRRCRGVARIYCAFERKLVKPWPKGRATWWSLTCWHPGKRSEFSGHESWRTFWPRFCRRMRDMV